MKINPILIKELKVRARSMHIPIFVMAYSAVLAFVGIFMLISSTDIFQIGGQNNYGKMSEMFLTIGFLQCAMIIMVSLAVSTSSFSGEKERGTLDLLLMTPVRTLEVVNGKLLSCVLTGFLFAFSSLPILLLGTVYGGTDLGDVFYLEIVLLFLAFSVSTRGILWSLIFDKTSVAVVFALLTEVFFFTGPFLLLEFLNAFLYNGYQYGTIGFPATAVSIIFQFFNPFMLIMGFYERIVGSSSMMEFFVRSYGIWEDSFLYQWLEQYFIISCFICQIIFTAMLHLVNVKILKKGRNIL